MPTISSLSVLRRSFVSSGHGNGILRDPHFIVPLLVLLIALVMVYAYNLDHRLADALYTWEGGQWRFRHKWLTSLVLHKYGQRFSISWGVVLLGITVASFYWARLRPYRWGLVCVDVAVIVSLLLVSLGKHMLAFPCPWDLQRYGGDVISAAAYQLHPAKVGGCFPAGHAAGGYCLFALYFFARQYRLRNYGLWLLPGIIVGLTYGIDQELRGAHFLSHDLVSSSLCWFMSYFMFRVFFPADSDSETAQTR